MLNSPTGSRLGGRRRSAGRPGVVLVALLLMTACGSDEQVVPTPSVSYGGGTITEAEYVSIVRAVRHCMMEKGYETDEVEKRQDGVTYGFGFSGGGGQRTTNGQEDLVSCEQEFALMEAELAFQDQHALTGAEREAAFSEFTSCMSAAGVSGITSALSVVEVQERMAELAEAGEDDSAAVACWTQHKSQLFGAAG